MKVLQLFRRPSLLVEILIINKHMSINIWILWLLNTRDTKVYKIFKGDDGALSWQLTNGSGG